MGIKDLLRQTIRQEQEQQGPAGLIVWYDQNGSLSSAVGEAVPEKTDFLMFEGSYLALRYILENEDPELSRRWVIYVPEKAPLESWLRDWELIGARREMDLLELLHRQYKLAKTPKVIGLLREYPQNSKDLVSAWDNLIGEDPVTATKIEDALLALCLGLHQWHVEEALLLFLAETFGKKELEGRGLWTILLERISAWIGDKDVPEDEEKLRRQLGAAILLSELVLAVPELAGRFSEVIPSEPRRPAVASLAGAWRSHSQFSDSYTVCAQKMEKEYSLQKELSLTESIISLETFLAIDELLVQEISNAAAPDGGNYKEKAEKIGDLAEKRKNLFWARSGQAPLWGPVSIAAKLYRGSEEAMTKAKGMSNAKDFTDAYTAEDGWWQLDLWALELSATAQDLSSEDQKRFINPAFRFYGNYVDQINRLFAGILQKEGWKPDHRDFWSRYVAGKKAVVFLVDALRFDLARHLKSVLPESEFEISFEKLHGLLPSVTELGMVALLPDALKGVKASFEADHLKVSINDQAIDSPKKRNDWLKKYLGKSGGIVPLNEVKHLETKKLKSLVVQSKEVDKFGTFAADLYPQGILEMVQKIAQAMCYLRDQGFEHFVVTSDHGFLFTPPGVEPKKIEAPDARICKRRFAIGGSQKGCFVADSNSIGLEGSEVFSFPDGLSVFALPGEIGSFLHGGLSLQECVIPVLKAKASIPIEKVSVSIEPLESLTSRIALISLRAEGVTLFPKPRRVILEIHGRRSEPVELSRESPKTTVHLKWLDFDESPPQTARLRLLDADSLQLLDELTTRVEIIV